MELLLNIVWLILALAALVTCWNARLISGKGHVSRFSLFVVVGCVLVLAFPVISVSDDLNALRAEIEESGVTDATLKKTVPHSSPVGSHEVPPSAAAPGSSSIGLENQRWEQVSKFQSVFIQEGSAIAMGCRAPPCLESAAANAPSMARLFKQDSMLAFRSISHAKFQLLQPRTTAASSGPRSVTCQTLLLTARGPLL